jgi:hypothetical protein
MKGIKLREGMNKTDKSIKPETGGSKTKDDTVM